MRAPVVVVDRENFTAICNIGFCKLTAFKVKWISIRIYAWNVGPRQHEIRALYRARHQLNMCAPFC